MPVSDLPSGFGPLEILSTILLIEPDVELLEIRRHLLATKFRVRTISGFRESFSLSPEDEPTIAAISDSLGVNELRRLAEYLRHRWPRTRILVVGRADPNLEDHLYDDTVDAAFRPQAFLEALLRHSQKNS